MLKLWSDRTIPPLIRAEYRNNLNVLGSAEESPEAPLETLPGANAIIAGAVAYTHLTLPTILRV